MYGPFHKGHLQKEKKSLWHEEGEITDSQSLTKLEFLEKEVLN